MVAVQLGAALGTALPSLDTYTAIMGFPVDGRPSPGTLVDPVSLEFQIFDVHDDTVAPVQVYPASAGTRRAVDLVVDRLGLGHFAATWTVPGNAALGRYEIRWFSQLVESTTAISWSREFEVLARVVGAGGGYALVADVREEGVLASVVGDARIQRAIERMSQLVEGWTGRVFVPTYKQIKIDSGKGSTILVGEPICAIESVSLGGDGAPCDPTSYRVYNRHLTQRLHRPDDREAPQIRFGADNLYPGVTDGAYPALAVGGLFGGWRSNTAQNVWINGVFGYTDPDGSPVGKTPANIVRAVVLMVLRDLPRAVSESDDRTDRLNASRVRAMRTREQSIEWSPRLASDQAAPFTGDPEIDSLILTYCQTLSITGV